MEFFLLKKAQISSIYISAFLCDQLSRKPIFNNKQMHSSIMVNRRIQLNSFLTRNNSRSCRREAQLKEERSIRPTFFVCFFVVPVVECGLHSSFHHIYYSVSLFIRPHFDDVWCLHNFMKTKIVNEILLICARFRILFNPKFFQIILAYQFNAWLNYQFSISIN